MHAIVAQACAPEVLHASGSAGARLSGQELAVCQMLRCGHTNNAPHMRTSTKKQLIHARTVHFEQQAAERLPNVRGTSRLMPHQRGITRPSPRPGLAHDHTGDVR